MFNPLTAMIGMGILIIGISLWGMATRESEEMSDDAYLAPDVKETLSDKRPAA